MPRPTRRFTALLALPLMVLPASQAAASDQPATPEETQIVSVQIDEARDIAVLSALDARSLMCEIRPGENTFLVRSDTLTALADAGLAPVVLDPTPEATALAARERALSRLDQRGDDIDDWWADYKPLDAIYAKMYEMQARYPDLVEVFEFGRSHQDRPLLAMRITGPTQAGDPCKPAVLLNSLTHAREWVPPMANMYVAENLITRYADDAYIRELVDSVEWVFVPVLNPDGYAYSWSDDRFWRKNRRDAGMVAPILVGVDINRNYSYEWGRREGSSAGRSAGTYRGPSPFSEPETAAIRDLALSMPQLRIHNDMHSYSQLVLFHWGYKPEPPENLDLMQALGEEMADRIEQYRGRNYDVGPGFTTIYPTSGSANDYYYGELGVASFTYELGRRFDESPEEMRQLVEESLTASLFHGEWAGSTFGFRADINNDCRHDFFDIRDFLDAYISGDPAADMDDTGDINPTDVTEFIDLFTNLQ